MKQNPCPVVGEVSETACIGFDKLDGTVEAHPFGRKHLVSHLFSQNAQHTRARGMIVNATQPEASPCFARASNSRGDLELDVKDNLSVASSCGRIDNSPHEN